MRTRLGISDFEDEKGLPAKECQNVLETRKVSRISRTVSLPEYPKPSFQSIENNFGSDT